MSLGHSRAHPAAVPRAGRAPRGGLSIAGGEGGEIRESSEREIRESLEREIREGLEREIRESLEREIRESLERGTVKENAPAMAGSFLSFSRPGPVGSRPRPAAPSGHGRKGFRPGRSILRPWPVAPARPVAPRGEKRGALRPRPERFPGRTVLGPGRSAAAGGKVRHPPATAGRVSGQAGVYCARGRWHRPGRWHPPARPAAPREEQ